MTTTATTLSTPNTLIETAKDGEYGFRTTAEYLKTPATRQLFLKRALECRRSAAALQALVVHLGGTAEDSGSASGALHRGWVAVKGTLSGYNDHALLQETENGEDSALKSYHKARAQDLTAEALAVVEQQLNGVKRNHDVVRTLREQARVCAAG